MKTNTQIKINKQLASQFEGWSAALKIPLETALQFAFNRLDMISIADCTKILSGLEGKEKYFQVNVDYDVWSYFKREVLALKGLDVKSGLEIAMSLFVKYYENKIEEVL